MTLFLGGLLLLATVLGLFWAKDELRSPRLARLAYSGLVARLAVLAGAFILLGLLMMIAELVES